MTPDPVRIQKALADAGVASRRAADQLVAAGRVTVNGAVAEIGMRVDPTTDRIEVDGVPLASEGEAVYLVLAKPAGVTSTVRDPHAWQTVVDLVPDALRRSARRLYPVGRLDRDSEGLLLLTNDGDWAQLLLHPRHEVEREYAIGLGRPLTEDQAGRLRDGIQLDEGRARIDNLRHQTRDETHRLEQSVRRSESLVWYRGTLTQGWRRQLRRMFAAVGAPVERLVRVRVGSVRLGSMRIGDLRPLRPAERDQLSRLARLEAPSAWRAGR